MPSLEPVSIAETLTLKQAALVVGFAYLLNPVTFAQAYAMPRLIYADPAETLAHLTAHPHLFSAAILSYVISALGDVVMAWAFYFLLRTVHRALALLGSVLQLVYAAAWLAAISNLGVMYRLVAVADYSQHVEKSMLAQQVTQLLAAYRSGWGLSLILFGLHLAVTGWLMVRSTFLPRWLGWLLLIDGCAWVADSVAIYVAPHADLSLLQIVFAAELILMVWLLGWGWRLREVQQAKPEEPLTVHPA